MIGVCQRIRFERLVLRIERLNPAVCHRTQYRDVKNLAGECAGCPGDSGNVGGTGTEYRCVDSLCAPGTEFHDLAPLGGAQNARGFRGDKALVIDGQKKHCLNQLRLNDGTFDLDNRFARENRRSLRYGPYIASELKMSKVVDEIIIKQTHALQIVEVFFRKWRFCK
jgi:hypothetical protein